MRTIQAETITEAVKNLCIKACHQLPDDVYNAFHLLKETEKSPSAKLLLDDIIDIGAYGIHPIERGSMDTRWLKETYGDKLCMVGNVDINYILKDAPLEEVDQEVKNCMDLLGKGGRYIISDSNSIPEWCTAQNVIEMGKAVEKYRYIY